MHELFGLKHIILIIVSLVLIVLGTIFSKKLSFQTVCKTMFFIGIVSETIKVFYYIIQNEAKYGGVLPKTDLPFHLCSIQIIFFIILCYSKSDTIKKGLLSFMLPSCLFGGIAAILIATNSSRNGMWIITFQYFMYHIAITIFSLYLLTSKKVKFTIKDHFSCLKFLGALMFFSIYINSILYDGESNINFMYVVSPPQEGLPFLNENHGWLVYIIHYAMLILFCVSLCYVKQIIESLTKKQNATISFVDSN